MDLPFLGNYFQAPTSSSTSTTVAASIGGHGKAGLLLFVSTKSLRQAVSSAFSISTSISVPSPLCARELDDAQWPAPARHRPPLASSPSSALSDLVEEEWPSPEVVAAALAPAKETPPEQPRTRRMLNKLPRLKKKSPKPEGEGGGGSSSSSSGLLEKLLGIGLTDPLIVDFLEPHEAEYAVDEIADAAARVMSASGVACNEALTMLLRNPSLFTTPEEKLLNIVDYLHSLGLAHSDISDVVFTHPALLECSLPQMRETEHFLLSSIGIAPSDLPTILLKRPDILTQNPQLVKDILGCLKEAGIPTKEIVAILNSHKDCPCLLTPRSQENMKPLVEFLKQVGVEGEVLGKGIARSGKIINLSLDHMQSTYKYLQKILSPAEATRLARRHVAILALDPVLHIEPIVRYLSSLGVKPQGLKKVLLRCPQLLRYTVQSLESNIQYLRELGIKERVLGKVIMTTPQVLTLKRDGKLERVIEFLRSIGLDDDADLGRLLSRNALMLCYSVENNIVPKINYFLSIGMSKKDVLRILVACPCLFSLSIETNIVPKINYFLDAGLSHEDVVKIMVAYPTMFGQSLGSLDIKYHHLVDVMKRPATEILSFPQYFGYSLEKRIKPRHEKLAARGIAASLPSMLICTDADFQERYILKENRSSESAYSKKRSF